MECQVSRFAVEQYRRAACLSVYVLGAVKIKSNCLQHNEATSFSDGGRLNVQEAPVRSIDRPTN